MTNRCVVLGKELCVSFEIYLKFDKERSHYINIFKKFTSICKWKYVMNDTINI